MQYLKIKNAKFLFLFFLLWSNVPEVLAQKAFCKITNQCIHSGEKIKFKVYYNWSFVWVPAGEANFTTTETTLNGKQVFHIVGDGATYKSYDWFFKVADVYQTWIDVKTMLPVRFDRHVREGSYRYDNVVDFYQNERYVISKGKMYKTPECIQDVLSAIFYARNINYNQFKPGDKIPFYMFLDDKVYSLYIRYLGKEEITTKYGTFHAIKIAPLLIKGTLFKGGEKMLVWVSDDKNHLPLRVSSPIVVGSIKADMISYKDLKYPLTSLIRKE